MNAFQHLAFLGNLNHWEIVAIVAVVLLLFGGKKLPELARGTGRALKEFKNAAREAEDTFKQAMDEVPDESGKKNGSAEQAKTDESREPASTETHRSEPIKG